MKNRLLHLTAIVAKLELIFSPSAILRWSQWSLSYLHSFNSGGHSPIWRGGHSVVTGGHWQVGKVVTRWSLGFKVVRPLYSIYKSYMNMPVTTLPTVTTFRRGGIAKTVTHARTHARARVIGQFWEVLRLCATVIPAGSRLHTGVPLEEGG